MRPFHLLLLGLAGSSVASNVFVNSLLDKCFDGGASLSKDCQNFIQKKWDCKEVEGVFTYIVNMPLYESRPLKGALKNQLLGLIETTDYAVSCLGDDPLPELISANEKDIAMAVWNHKENQKWSRNHSKWCSTIIDKVIEKNMSTLLQEIIQEHPTCLEEFSGAGSHGPYYIMSCAIKTNNIDMVGFLVDQGELLFISNLLEAYELGYHSIVQWGIKESLFHKGPDMFMDYRDLVRIAVGYNKLEVCKPLYDLNWIGHYDFEYVIDEFRKKNIWNNCLEFFEHCDDDSSSE